MSKTTPMLALVAAFAAASAQAAVDPSEGERRQERRAMVNQQLRDVEVELYCGHQDQAIGLIRDARRQLMATRDESSRQDLQQLDRASWLVRHGDTTEAIATLETLRQA